MKELIETIEPDVFELSEDTLEAISGGQGVTWDANGAP
jgi:hypothetical protein